MSRSPGKPEEAGDTTAGGVAWGPSQVGEVGREVDTLYVPSY